jgi:hypothetical protein
MSGLYLLAIAAVWLAFVAALSYALTSRIKAASLRVVVALLVAAVLLPLPLIDEILGRRQFEQLCKDNSTIQVDRKTAVGKTVYYVPQPAAEVPGAWVRIVVKPQRFVDAATGEPVVTYNELMADGGRLVQVFGISEGKVPLTFRSTCVPPNRPASVQTFKPLGINYVEPPSRNNGEQK